VRLRFARASGAFGFGICLVLTVLQWKGLKLPEVGFIAGLMIGGGLILYALVSLFFPASKAQNPVQRVIHEHQSARFGGIEVINVMVEEQARALARRRAEEEYGSKDP
jgi:multisubunit Na+/H+ antiporter MnhB subunit